LKYKLKKNQLKRTKKLKSIDLTRDPSYKIVITSKKIIFLKNKAWFSMNPVLED
jgi:hypothetical protein